MPCVICFVDGVGVDRIIGFEGVGYKPDSFTLRELELRLLRSNVIVRSKMVEDDEDAAKRNRDRKQAHEDEDSGDDWD